VIGAVVAVGVIAIGDIVSEVRGGKKLQWDPNAEGPHCTWKPGHWAEWNPNPNNQDQWDPGPRYDQTGASHGDVETPHVHVPGQREAVPGSPIDRMPE
jgi:hypothetical protein